LLVCKRKILSMVVACDSVSNLATDLACRSGSRGCIGREVRAAASAARERSTTLIVWTSSMSTISTSSRYRRSRGEVGSRWINIQGRYLMFQLHLMCKEMSIEFINRKGINSICDRGDTKGLDSLKLFGDGTVTFLNNSKLKINLLS